MLPRAVLALTDEELAERVREAALASLEADEPSEAFENVGVIVELDNQVLNGGFSQYFFNPSFAGVLNAWMFSKDNFKPLAALIEATLQRLEAQFGGDLDIAKRFDVGGAGGLGPILMELMRINRAATEAEEDPYDAFMAFHRQVVDDKAGVAGFGPLDDRYLDDFNVDKWLVKWVREHQDPVFKA